MHNNNKNNNSNNNNNNNNKFTIVDFPKDGQNYGSFLGKVPKKVASKAFSSLIQFMNINNNKDDDSLGKFIVFVIKNVNTGKMYKYIGNRVKYSLNKQFNPDLFNYQSLNNFK
jgi:hypothetical protein